MRRAISLVPLFTLALAACGENPAPAPVAPTAEASAPPPLAAGPASSGPEAVKLTARSMLEAAIAEARRWQPDAELTVVTTSLADGPAHDFWFYDFQSPATSTCTRIRALASSGVANAGSGEACRLTTPVSIGFVDSPRAYDAAVAAGFRKGESVQFGLRLERDQALSTPRECWVVWSDADGDEEKGVIRGWCMDPATGAFVTRLSGSLAPASPAE